MALDTGYDDGSDEIVPHSQSKRSLGQSFSVSVINPFQTTPSNSNRSYDYAFLFKPNLPFKKKSRRTAPFFTLNQRMPEFITPPIIISAAAGFSTADTQYLVSTSLIVSGILSGLQITRLHLYKTPYYFGTGLISVVETSFSTVPVASAGISQIYSNGMCPTAEDGSLLPCPEGYGAILGTAALCWAGGSGSCMSRPTTGDYMLCPSNSAPHALPWSSAEFVGLGFSVFVMIILCERFGSPIMKSTSVVFGLLTGCIIAAACGHFDRSSIDAASAVSFLWLTTFPLSIYGPLILPMLVLYLVLMMESIGDITATCDVSRLQVEGKLFDSRIQGGVLADGVNGMLACLCTITPMSTFAQNNGVIALTRCANRKAGYAACAFLVLMGIFAKFAAALVAIPASVLGGMTTFLFASVAVSGIRIISTVLFTRRTRFVLTGAMSLGFGAALVLTWFSYVFTYTGNNRAKSGFFDAIALVIETSFAITALVAVILNLIVKEDDENEETESVGEDEIQEDETFQASSDTAGMKVAGTESVRNSKSEMSAK
ncbi:Xanthine/uracil permease [Stipitochalara longipes BDJ]|nr:Xanthine/uracil permease [Stipitochalara longipes BDJ]